MSRRPDAPTALALLAEPDVIARHTLAEFLRNCGLHVVEAATSEAAIAVFNESGFDIDILLCDAKLGGELGGFGLARWVREHRPAVDIELTGSLAATAGAAHEICEEVSKGEVSKPDHSKSDQPKPDQWRPEPSKLRPGEDPQSVVDRILQLRAARDRNR
ncbi:hypothetical protein KX816_08970 [Sphingosinicellaceae bacterium]|nr:hypothetical protein KX816_08970 [Sphingosinicellaceae bacterium]